MFPGLKKIFLRKLKNILDSIQHQSKFNYLMKRIILCFILISPFILSGQITNSEEPGTLDQFLNNLTGSLESNIQWYVNDKTLGDFTEENQFSENSKRPIPQLPNPYFSLSISNYTDWENDLRRTPQFCPNPAQF